MFTKSTATFSPSASATAFAIGFGNDQCRSLKRMVANALKRVKPLMRLNRKARRKSKALGLDFDELLSNIQNRIQLLGYTVRERLNHTGLTWKSTRRQAIKIIKRGITELTWDIVLAPIKEILKKLFGGQFDWFTA